ncbi:MAG TPA: 2-dehydropantoate 2-reductase [Polyangiaceae bacterium]|jgi:2-dehydropantoate 2-reductase
MRLLVMGCGGIGGIATALLAESGHDVTAFTTNAAIAEAATREGLQLRGDAPPRAVRARVLREMPDERFDVVLLCTQPPQVEDAARAALGVLADDGVMVCLQNGLCESRVAAIAGEARTLGAVVAWGAAMHEPGVYERTAPGGFALGGSSSRLDEVARALEVIGPVEITDNLAGKRWSKLAINAAISSLGTIGGERLGALLQHRFVRRLALEIMSECVYVARKCGVRLEKVAGTFDLDWLALREDERLAAGSPSLVAKHAMLLAVGFRYRRMRSSMLAAIERGRVPAVEFLNGEVCERGRALGVATPANDAARAFVWAVARGERTSGMEALRDLSRALSPHD